jgi:hypothetical protein
MADKEPVHFDIETILLLREALVDAWASLRPAEQAATTRSQLAERILKSAAQGERDPERLIEVALQEFSVEEA